MFPATDLPRAVGPPECVSLVFVRAAAEQRVTGKESSIRSHAFGADSCLPCWRRSMHIFKNEVGFFLTAKLGD